MSEFLKAAQVQFEAAKLQHRTKKHIANLAEAGEADLRLDPTEVLFTPQKRDRHPGLILGHAVIPSYKQPLILPGRLDSVISRIGTIEVDSLLKPEDGIFAAYHDAPTEVEQIMREHEDPIVLRTPPLETIVFATTKGTVRVRQPHEDTNTAVYPIREPRAIRKELTLEEQLAQKAGRALDAIVVCEFVGEGLNALGYNHTEALEQLAADREAWQRYEPSQERNPLIAKLVKN